MSGISRMVLTSTNDSGSKMDMAPPNNWHLVGVYRMSEPAQNVFARHESDRAHSTLQPDLLSECRRIEP